MANSVGPDQLAYLSGSALQRQGTSGFSRTRVNHTVKPVLKVTYIYKANNCIQKTSFSGPTKGK